MVSCDPATLARDVRTLTNARFVVKSVDVFEMFPHTSHVESMVVLEREPGARSG
jgi:23S rRNA (uracil1939-C5)-methyltransferase